MPPQQLDIEEIQLREVQAISGRIYSPTTSSSTTAMLLEECKSSKRRSTKWPDNNDDELMPMPSSRSLAQPTRLTRRITPDNTPSQIIIPQHWPISATSTEDIKGHVRPLPFDVFSKKKRKDTNTNNRQLRDQEREERKEERPVYFYSINTMLHQQEEECWENIICDDTTSEESDEDMLLLGELIQDACRQPVKSCLRNESSAPPRIRKSVNFSIEELTSTHVRPRTSTKDIPNLYYTEDEIYEMKCAYRSERREERRIEKTRAMEEWKKKINRLYGDGITSFSATDDEMLVEAECRQGCKVKDDLDTQSCLSWG